MNSHDVITALENTSSRTAKEEIIKNQADIENDAFFEGVRYALDPLITFGLKDIEESNSLVAGDGLPQEEFIKLANKLMVRELTGNAARNAVANLMGLATQDEWNYWYRRILIKDLRCGVSEKTINKVKNKKYHVPVFSCQLAEDSANHEKKVSGEKMLQVKLDGIRAIAVMQKGFIKLFSRNGKELTNFPAIEKSLETIFEESGPIILDGEIMSANFQELMKNVFRKGKAKTEDAVFNVFDYMTIPAWQKGKWTKPQLERAMDIQDLIDKHDLMNVQTLPFECVNLDTEEGQKKFRSFNKEAIDGGFEGIMIKDLDAPYECKRTRHWLKMKPFIEVSLECIGFEEGTGKNQGRLGALICQGEDDGKNIQVNVGSGFSDEQRDDFWINKDKLLNMVVEIRADAVTQNQEGTYSLRFPRFKTFRGTHPHEKI